MSRFRSLGEEELGKDAIRHLGPHGGVDGVHALVQVTCCGDGRKEVRSKGRDQMIQSPSEHADVPLSILY